MSEQALMNLIFASLVATATLCLLLALAWRSIAADPFASRLQALADARAKPQTRKQRKKEIGELAEVSLRVAAKPLYQRIFDYFRLQRHAEELSTIKLLRMAGLRGRGPIITYLAIRVLSPFVAAVGSALYLTVVIGTDRPFFLFSLVATIGLAGWFAPTLYLKNRIARRQIEIKQAWPDALDLLLICVESGMGLEPALVKVSAEIGAESPVLAEELQVLIAELSYMDNRHKAYEHLVERIGLDVVKSATTGLVQAEKYGTSLGQTLRVLSRESRDIRMAEAETKAASLPPKLTVPMILFFLPVLFAVIMTPTIIRIMAIK